MAADYLLSEPIEDGNRELTSLIPIGDLPETLAMFSPLCEAFPPATSKSSALTSSQQTDSTSNASI